MTKIKELSAEDLEKCLKEYSALAEADPDNKMHAKILRGLKHEVKKREMQKEVELPILAEAEFALDEFTKQEILLEGLDTKDEIILEPTRPKQSIHNEVPDYGRDKHREQSDDDETSKYYPSGHGRRFLAYFINVFTVNIISIFAFALILPYLDIPFDSKEPPKEFIHAMAILMVTLSMLFLTLASYSITKYRGTLGKRIVGLSLVDYYDEPQIISFQRAFSRTLINAILSLLWLVPGLIILVNKDRRGIADFICRTKVVQNANPPPLSKAFVTIILLFVLFLAGSFAIAYIVKQQGNP